MCRLLGQLSQIQQQLVQPGHHNHKGGTAGDTSLSAEVDRLGICFVIATVQVETAAQLLKVRTAIAVHQHQCNTITWTYTVSCFLCNSDIN